MKEYIRDLIWGECVKANNHIEIPAIYRHFKKTKDGEDMIYAVSNISVPIPHDEINGILEEGMRYVVDMDVKSLATKILHFYHTELENHIFIYRKGDKYYHSDTIEKEKLVIYTGLYGGRDTYARPLPMFLSKVDKEKYPDADQQFRLERVL